MRFTPSTKFLMYAIALAKSYRWRVYLRKVTDISLPLDEGNWLEVTDRIDMSNFPDSGSTIEWAVGQFSSDGITLQSVGSTGVESNIAWWKANIFNTMPDEYIEVKVQFELGLARDFCSDIVYTFSGFLDKRDDGSQYAVFTEDRDSVEFSVRTLQDYGTRIPAENLTTQYIESDVEGNGTSVEGLFLHEMRGIFITNAAVEGFVMQKGAHRISATLKSVTELAGSDQIVNGTFEDASGWVAGAGWSIDIVAHNAACSGAQSPNPSILWQLTDIQPGYEYSLTYTLTRSAGSIIPIVGGTPGTSRTAGGTYTEVFTPTAQGLIRFQASYNFVGTVDTITLTRLAKTTETLVLKLDEGRETELTEGEQYVELGNADLEGNDIQRLEVYVRAFSDLFVVHPLMLMQTVEDVTFESPFVVTAPGEILPLQWFTNVGIKYLLRETLAHMGVEDVTFNTLDIPYAPAPAPDVPKITFIDNPPNAGIVGEKWAMANDGTDLYVSVGHRIYHRSTTEDAYTLVATLTPGDRVSRLLYNARNNHLWVFYGNTADDFGTNTNGNGKLRRLALAGMVLSDEIVLTTKADKTRAYAIDIIDYEYQADAWVYGIVYADGNDLIDAGRLQFINGATLAPSTILTGTDIGLVGNGSDNFTADFLFIRNGNEVHFKGIHAGSGRIMVKTHIDAAGAWVSDGITLTNVYPYNTAVYHPIDDRIYFWYTVESAIVSHTPLSSSVTENITGVAAGSTVEAMIYAAGKAYFTIFAADPLIAGRLYYLYALSGNEVHDFQDYIELSNTAAARGTALSYLGGVIYGVDLYGVLWQYSDRLRYCSPVADFANETITSAFNKILQSFNLTGNVSSTKKAYIYTRGDDEGNAQTSGHILDVTINEASNIIEENSDFGAAFNQVRVTNGNTEWSFNGLLYNQAVLGDARVFTIDSPLIPREVVQDLCYNAYQFFKSDKVLYTIDLGGIAQYQFEPFDGCTIRFNTTRIQKVAENKPIYATTLTKTGSMQIQVLV